MKPDTAITILCLAAFIAAAIVHPVSLALASRPNPLYYALPR